MLTSKNKNIQINVDITRLINVQLLTFSAFGSIQMNTFKAYQTRLNNLFIKTHAFISPINTYCPKNYI